MKRIFATIVYRLRRRAAIRHYSNCVDRTVHMFAAYSSAEAELRAALAAEGEAEKRMEQFTINN